MELMWLETVRREARRDIRLVEFLTSVVEDLEFIASGMDAPYRLESVIERIRRGPGRDE